MVGASPPRPLFPESKDNNLIDRRPGERGSMGSTMRRPQRLSLTQQCAESMKQHIMRSALKPGDRLPTEQEWVEMLGVSWLVVREALQMLAGSGLYRCPAGACWSSLRRR